ncbi:hypothetical protein DI272_18880 [Streptomyces sp. Act143]|uniref:hypothetical protein n=1 Tax=Streptomyces sp. Act143 TaxID=2200760 RepID=UPI000D68437F|nr:hypothetical protein [Streptomyces sp. Act143]PWI15998.1 hypothetical protein DI272_18880 [Streptomyces sp. Act143]
MTATHIPPSMAREIIAHIGRNAPLREARAYSYLREAGFTVDDLALMADRRPAFIGWRLDLLKLCQRGQTALDAGEISWNLAWEIAQLSEPNQNLMLTRWARGEFTSSRHAERYARAIAADETGTASPERARGTDNGGTHWTPDEDQWLLDHWGHSNAQLAEDLGRTENAIPHRRRALRPEEFARQGR